MESIERHKCLLEKVELVKEFAKAKHKESASDFNIFRVLGLERAEVRTHSAFLAELLNPRGSHGQGALFLKAFLRQCKSVAEKSKSCKFEYPGGLCEEWNVTTERYAGEHGRLDIVLECPTLKTVVAIENKVDAEERDKQLEDYWMWIKETLPRDWNRLLVFLTPDGRPSKSAENASYIPLSYRENIDQMLDYCRAGIPEKLKSVIDQYQEVIRQIAGEDIMTEEQRRLSALLQEGNNLSTAFKIYDAVEIVKQDLLTDLWPKTIAKMKSVIEQHEYAQKWETQELDYPKGRPRTYTDNWFGVGWIIKSEKSDIPQLRFSITQELKGRSLHIYYGVNWNSPPKDKSSIESSETHAELEKKLKGTAIPRTDWFPFGYDKIQGIDSIPDLRADFIHQLAVDIVNEAWEKFELVEKFLAEFNRGDL